MFIRLLGAVGAGVDEHDVRPAPGQVAAGVLAHLAMASGRVVPVESLARAVWDDPPESARNAIQVAVSKLRKLYGAYLFEGARTGYRLAAGVVRIDWAEATRHASEARVALDSGRPTEALAAAEALGRLFAGEPLAGLATTAADAARHRAQELHTTGQLVQARALLQLGRADAAVELLRELVAADPLQEPAHAVLMEALAVAGRPAEALALYDELRRRLAHELGADPSPAVQETFTRLLDGTATPHVAAARQPARGGGVRLPSVGGPLLGREMELEVVTGLVGAGHRLVTLVGPGGIGKTRLAIAVAQRVAHEQDRPALFVDLTAVGEASRVGQTIEAAVEAEDSDIAGALRATRTLVVLDNAEHVLDAAADAASGLLAIDGLDVVVTSRSPLRLRDERTVWVDVLRAAEVDDPAVELLVERAALTAEQRATHADDLRALARRADGIPLVLELLASALRWQTPQQLLERLDATLLDLRDDARDRPERHVSVAAAADWSLRQASEQARAGLGALTVARGSFSLEAATDIIPAAVPGEPARKVLAELVDLSLVQRLPELGRIRFRILEPIRIHASASPRVRPARDDANRAHAIHYLRAAEQADALYAETEDAVAELLREDSANVTKAIEWAWANEPDTAVAYLGSLLFAWLYRDRFPDVMGWSERALSSEAGTPAARAKIALARFHLLLMQQSQQAPELQALSELARPYVEVFDDEWRRRWVTCQAEWSRQSGDETRAIAWLDEYPVNTPRDSVRRVLLRVHLLMHAERWAEASRELEDLLRLPEVQDDALEHLLALNSRGYTALAQGEVEIAAPYLDRALEIAESEGLTLMAALVVNNLAWLALDAGEPDRALHLVASNIVEPTVQADHVQLVEAATIAGLALLRRGRHGDARALATKAAAINASVDFLLDSYGAAHLEELVAAAGIDPQQSCGMPASDIPTLIAQAALT